MAATRPARQKFLQRFEQEVDPDGVLPPQERRRRAAHAKRAYMLRLAKRAVNAARWIETVTRAQRPPSDRSGGLSVAIDQLARSGCPSSFDKE